MKKKVLFFLPSSCGGAERMTILIAKFLKEADFIASFVIVGREKEISLNLYRKICLFSY